MRRPSLSEGLCFAFGIFAAVAFWAVSVTVNSTPSPPSFDGWVAVLQQRRHASSMVKVTVTPTVPGGLGGTPRVRYSVAVCGPTPFRGVLLLGRDARISNLHVIAPPASVNGPEPTQPGEPISARRTLKMLDVSAGLFLTYDDTQVIRLALPATKCALTRQEYSREGSFFGAAAVVEGNAESAVETRSQGPLGLWTGPRSTQSWPYLGGFPGVSPYNLGEFRFVRGLRQGPWSRPSGSQFAVDVGSLAEKATVDFARPTPSSSTSLSWNQAQPYAPIARLTDTDSLGVWQTYLVLSTIALAVGASFIAALLLRAPKSAPEVKLRYATDTSKSAMSVGGPAWSSQGWVIGLVLLVWIFKRSRR